MVTGLVQFGGEFSFVPLGLHHLIEFFKGASKIVMTLTKVIKGEGNVVVKNIDPETVNRVMLG